MLPFPSGKFYYFSLCHVCKTHSNQIRRCSACKTAAYCSAEHQRIDWKNHKNLCKAISHTSKNDSNVNNFEEWTRHRLECGKVWVEMLKRELEPFESQIWMFPRVCNVCYKPDQLIECLECLNVAYCSLEHMNKDRTTHETFCTALKLCMNLDQYLLTEQRFPEIKFKSTVHIPETIPIDIVTLLEIVEERSESETHKTEKNTLEFILKSESLVPAGTVLFALNFLKLNTTGKSKVTIHVVGAAAAEATSDWGLAAECLFHWMYNLEELVLMFIGPEMWNITENLFSLCSKCSEKKFHVQVYQDLYHNVYNSVDPPDVKVIFNNGFHEFVDQDGDLWGPSIALLLENKIAPLILTSYTEEEMECDLKRLFRDLQVDVEVLLKRKNPFASLRPIRDWCSKNSPVFYSNAYISIVTAV